MISMRSRFSVLIVLQMLFVFPVVNAALAGEADVVGVKVTKTGEGTFRFDVTVKHGDTGWDHYADKWDVVAPDGTVLGTRILHHPHVDEQPFTRSLGGVKIPASIARVTLRAHDKVDLYGGVEKMVEVPH